MPSVKYDVNDESSEVIYRAEHSSSSENTHNRSLEPSKMFKKNFSLYLYVNLFTIYTSHNV